MAIRSFVGVEMDGVPMRVVEAETLIDNQLGALIDQMSGGGNLLSCRQRLVLLDKLKQYREPLQSVFAKYEQLMAAANGEG